MDALEQVKNITREEALRKLASSKIEEYGLFPGAVAERWQEAMGAGLPIRLAAAVNHADTAGVLLGILWQYPEQVLTGLEIAAYILDAVEIVLQLPAGQDELLQHLEKPAKERNIRLHSGFINSREREQYLWHHIVTMKDIHDCFLDSYEEGIWVSVNGDDLKKYPKSLQISELVTTTELKAVEIGYHLYLPVILEQTLEGVGVPNGLINTYTARTCVVNEAYQRTLSYRRTSCGRCVFCREGLIQLNGMMKDIADGKGKGEYLEIMQEVGTAMSNSTLCSLGQESAGLTVDTIKLFREELDMHMKKKRCPAQVCTAFQLIYIDPHTCEGCGECMDVCPAGCIEGKSGFIHMIDDFECTKCGKCVAACEAGAVIQTTGKVPKLPSRLVKCGKFKKHG